MGSMVEEAGRKGLSDDSTQMYKTLNKWIIASIFKYGKEKTTRYFYLPLPPSYNCSSNYLESKIGQDHVLENTVLTN